MNVQGYSVKGSERKENCRERFCLPKEHLNNPKQNVGRYMDCKSHSDMFLERNKDMLLETRRKIVFVIKWQRT